jgi:hypothetical protein
MVGARPEHDKRVSRVLESLDLEYTIDDDGDFRLIFKMEGDRTQVVFIQSSTSEYRDLEIRDVFSVGYESEDEVIPEDIANRLLGQNWKIKLGAWAKMGKYAVFVSKVDANAGGKTLWSAIKLTAKAADEMESELTGKADSF